MSIDPADDQIYRTQIRPSLFADSPGGEATPIVVLLGSQAGSGRSRSSARLLADHGGMAAVSGDDLRIFHPKYRGLATGQPEAAGTIVDQAVRPWVSAVIQDCLDERRSFLLEGSFGDPDVTLSTASRFRAAGFDVRIAAVASPRVLSLVTAASRYLHGIKMGAPTRFTSRSAHDRGYDGTARLIDALELTTAVERLTIVGRNGTVLLDRSATEDIAAPFSGASQALHGGRHPDSWGARTTMELLGELKQVTRFAIESGNLTADTAELLIEAHTQALEEVVPRLSVDGSSPQAQFIHQAVSEQLVTLRRAAAKQHPSVSGIAEIDLSSLPISTIESDR